MYINTSPASPVLGKCSLFKQFFGAGKMCINTSPAPERCLQIHVLPRLLRRRRSVFKYFSGAGEMFLYIYTYLIIPIRRRKSLGSIKKHLSGAGEVFKHTFPAPEKYLYTLIWRWRSRRSRRSIYIHPYDRRIIEVIWTGVYKYFSGFFGFFCMRQISVAHFSSAGKVCINTYPAPEMCI